jgi:hypothetical protein
MNERIKELAEQAGLVCESNGNIYALTNDLNCLERFAELVRQDEREAWRNAAIRLGEELSSVGPDCYYDMTAKQWLDWALDQQPKGKNSLPAAPQAEKQEPVAWMYVNVDGECEQIEYGACDYDDPSITFLYTAPPRKEWVGLTFEEVNEIRKDIFQKYQKALLVTRDVTSENDYSAFNFYRAIEDKLRSKND